METATLDDEQATRDANHAATLANVPDFKAMCADPTAPAISLYRISNRFGTSGYLVFRKRERSVTTAYSDCYGDEKIRLDVHASSESATEALVKSINYALISSKDNALTFTPVEFSIGTGRIERLLSASGFGNFHRGRVSALLQRRHSNNVTYRNPTTGFLLGATGTAVDPRWVAAYDSRTLKAGRIHFKRLAELMAEAVRSYRESEDVFDFEAVTEFMAESERTYHYTINLGLNINVALGDTHNAQMRMRYANDRVLERIEELVGDSTWARADCGHIEHRGNFVEAADDSSYCQSCSDDVLVYMEREEGFPAGHYNRDNLHFWDRDDEYHHYPEPYNSSYDESSELMSWGVDVSHYVQHDTSFTPSQYGDFTMGVELEVDSDGDDLDGDIVATRKDLNSHGYNYCVLKRDGSLGEYGYEIVTAARKLEDHLHAFAEWEPVAGLTSWNSGDCGMHVHMDSRAFTAMTLGKFMVFINSAQNATFIREIAGRHPSRDEGAASYCQSIGSRNLVNPSKAIKTSENASRYRMVNLCNLRQAEMDRLQVENVDRESKGSYSTVELRIFRGTLRKSRLLAQIEFAHAAVTFCRVASWNKLDGESFKTWLKTSAGRYKNLAKWYGITVVKQDVRPGKTKRLVSTSEV